MKPFARLIQNMKGIGLLLKISKHGNGVPPGCCLCDQLSGEVHGDNKYETGQMSVLEEEEDEEDNQQDPDMILEITMRTKGYDEDSDNLGGDDVMEVDLLLIKEKL